MLTLQVLWELLVNHVGEITSIVEDHVEGFAFREGSQGLLDAPEVLLFGLTLPGKDGHASGGDSVATLG